MFRYTNRQNQDYFQLLATFTPDYLPKSRNFSTFGDFCTPLFAKIKNFFNFWRLLHTIICQNQDFFSFLATFAHHYLPKSRFFSTFGDFYTPLFAKIWNFSHFWQTIIRNNIVLRYATSTTFIMPFGVLKNQHSGLVNNEVVLDDLFD